MQHLWCHLIEIWYDTGLLFILAELQNWVICTSIFNTIMLRVYLVTRYYLNINCLGLIQRKFSVVILSHVKFYTLSDIDKLIITCLTNPWISFRRRRRSTTTKLWLWGHSSTRPEQPCRNKFERRCNEFWWSSSHTRYAFKQSTWSGHFERKKPSTSRCIIKWRLGWVFGHFWQ